LLAGAAVTLALSPLAGIAHAQTVDGALEEIVVTATRQADTVNRVPLSVTAQTQKNLDQQGIKSVTDLQATVPALQVNQQLATGVANIAIRGIVQGAQGAATTGFYLDDTPLQKRNVGGGVATANGTPLPPLFDLERIEVLRGPQGTLYGGSSEGGTIRYIQPAPSLTTYSSYARAQVSSTRYGDPSYEAGVAVGGPIVKDKLGFRASVFGRKTGGFIDMVDPITKQVYARDVNDGKIKMGRLALTWAPVENARITLDYFSSQDKSDSLSSSFNLDWNNALVVPTVCFNSRATPTAATFNAAGVNTSANRQPVETLPVGAAARLTLVPVGINQTACNSLAAQGQVTHTVPGYTYGPYNLDPYQSLAVTTSPTKTNLQVAKLTFDYEFEHMSVKAITSYIEDSNKTLTSETSQITRFPLNATYGDIKVPTGLPFQASYAGSQTGVGRFFGRNQRVGLNQELRFSSAGNARPFSWVAGIFYSNQRESHRLYVPYDLETLSRAMFGITSTQRYSLPPITTPAGHNDFEQRMQNMTDVELAAFGEGNYWLTEKLRLTAGIRVSRLSYSYYQTQLGPVNATTVVSPANYNTNNGQIAESPVTPKVGLQYMLSNSDMVYATASKGFRGGGLNSFTARTICAQALDQYQLQPQDLPQSYKSDSVWSYETGGKFRLFGRIQLNAAAYQIDWQNTQITLSPGFNCGLVNTYNTNGARSRGAEVEVTARVFDGLTLNGAFGYNNTKYTAKSVALTGPTGIEFVTTLKDQKFALPPWTLNVGGRYEHDLVRGARGYIRGDFRYTKGYQLTPFGTAGWNPDANVVPSIYTLNLRAGVEYRDFDINLFVNNALNRDRGQLSGGRTGCTLPQNGGTEACSSFTGFNPYISTSWGTPREIGFQIAYRH
jgi:outer membrane receptor protein involved in Fe transport